MNYMNIIAQKVFKSSKKERRSEKNFIQEVMKKNLISLMELECVVYTKLRLV